MHIILTFFLLFMQTMQAKVSPSRVAAPLLNQKNVPTAGASSSYKDDSFHTPLAKDSMLSASLRAGAFDTNANVLLTCSLPDLRSLFTSSPQAVPPAADEEETPNNQEASEEQENEEEQEPVSKFREENEERSCKEEEEEYQEEEEEEDKLEEEAWSSSDEEDMHQLVQTLQSYVEESSMF